MATVLPTLGYRLYMLLPTFYELIYLPIGVLFYLASMLHLSDWTKSKLRLTGKSFFAGGIIGLVLFAIAISQIFGRYM
jgi:hypothetical protein